MYQRIKRLGQAAIMMSVLCLVVLLSGNLYDRIQEEENVNVLTETETMAEIVKQERDLVSSTGEDMIEDESAANGETEEQIDTETIEAESPEGSTAVVGAPEADAAQEEIATENTTTVPEATEVSFTQEAEPEVLSAYTDSTQLGEIYTPVCEEYQGYIEEICTAYGIMPELVVAIMESESGGVRTAYNGAYGCVGLMQINESVHQGRMKKLGVTDLYDPYSNILVGVDLLSELLENDDQNIYLALAHYHGERNANSRTRSGNYSSYVKKIMARTQELLQEQGKG